MRIATALAFGVGLIASPLNAAIAQEPAAAVTPEHTELARRYVSIGGAEELFFRGVLIGFEGALLRNGRSLTADQRTALEPVLRQSFSRSAQIFTNELTTFYVNNASVEDLTAAVTYYESEPGQRYAVVATDIVLALASYAVSGGRTAMPDVLEESEMNEPQRALATRLTAAFGGRLGDLEREQLRAAGLDPVVFMQLMAHYFVGRLSLDDLEAAVEWAETPHSQRLERSSAERSVAEEVASLRALQAFDAESAAQEIARVLDRAPT
jgi:hypothetical protein